MRGREKKHTPGTGALGCALLSWRCHAARCVPTRQQAVGLLMAQGWVCTWCPPAVLPDVLSLVPLAVHMLVPVLLVRPLSGQVGAMCQHLSVRGNAILPRAKRSTSLLFQKGLQITTSHQFFRPCKRPQHSNAIALSVMHGWDRQHSHHGPWLGSSQNVLLFACQHLCGLEPRSSHQLCACILNIHPRPWRCGPSLSQNKISFLRGLGALIHALLSPPPPLPALSLWLMRPERLCVQPLACEGRADLETQSSHSQFQQPFHTFINTICKDETQLPWEEGAGRMPAGKHIPAAHRGLTLLGGRGGDELELAQRCHMGRMCSGSGWW